MTMSRADVPELWGGLECTIARIGDVYRDQFAETGHHDRAGDLDLIAELGIRTLRYPVLMEATSGEINPGRGWDWHDARLDKLRRLGIDPIIGLIHHGSGPRDTDLLDRRFPDRLAEHARLVAKRYPWVTRYTPVNEPLTTARFSALYGHWYPHRRSVPDFLRTLVNQCRAVTLSMRSIREVNPAAELVQTEDIGRVFSTPLLAYQADHENDRRWLSLDLLFGRVRPDHPCWRLLIDNGIKSEELEPFWHEPHPSVIGVNHYLTSDRFLDENIGAYPEHFAGGNDRQPYADVEAVRIRSLSGLTGPEARLREVATRYGSPIAITEVHHGSTRDEQLRWLKHVWDAACVLRREGIDLRAVTIWSMFGAVDWNSLLTRRAGIYEPGAFDVRGAIPRRTALARAVVALTSTGHFTHPVLDQDGWWQRQDRFYSPERPLCELPPLSGAVVALISPPGAFADEFTRVARQRGIAFEIVAPGRGWAEANVADAWAIIDATGLNDPEAHLDLLRTRLRAAAARSIPYVFYSRSEVFHGRSGTAFSERDEVSTSSVTSRLLAMAEAVVTGSHSDALILRCGFPFGPGSRSNPKQPIPPLGRADVATEGVGSCTYVPDLMHVTLDLLIDGDTGIRHLVNRDMTRMGAMPSVVRGDAPPFAIGLKTDRGDLMPPLDSAMIRFRASTALPTLQAAE